MRLRGGGEALLALGSVLVLLLVALMCEWAVRTFSDVVFLGSSRNLFIADAYGPSKGNARNAEGVSYEAVVYTDEFGFRVPRGGVPGDRDKNEAILILGDSVGFGPGVEEAATFAGLLRKRYPDKRIYNSSVIGYTTEDYANVIEAFLPHHEEIVAVVLVVCLNDINAKSAENIDRYLEQKAKKEPGTIPEQKITEALRSLSLFRDANEFLRSRSKLYLMVKNELLSSQKRGWKALVQLYGEHGRVDVERSARTIAAIATTLEARGIPFVVVLSPLEYQLRNPEDPETEVPQRDLTAQLAARGVSAVDARPAFDPALPSSDYFLAYDPFHLSERGHQVMAEIIARELER